MGWRRGGGGGGECGGGWRRGADPAGCAGRLGAARAGGPAARPASPHPQPSHLHSTNQTNLTCTTTSDESRTLYSSPQMRRDWPFSNDGSRAAGRAPLGAAGPAGAWSSLSSCLKIVGVWRHGWASECEQAARGPRSPTCRPSQPPHPPPRNRTWPPAPPPPPPGRPATPLPAWAACDSASCQTWQQTAAWPARQPVRLPPRRPPWAPAAGSTAAFSGAAVRCTRRPPCWPFHPETAPAGAGRRRVYCQTSGGRAGCGWTATPWTERPGQGCMEGFKGREWVVTGRGRDRGAPPHPPPTVAGVPHARARPPAPPINPAQGPRG